MSSNASHLTGNALHPVHDEDCDGVYQPNNETPPPSPNHCSCTESVCGCRDCDDGAAIAGAVLKRLEYLYTAAAATRYRKKYFHCFIPIPKYGTPHPFWSTTYERMDEMEGIEDHSSHFIQADLYNPDQGAIVKREMYFVKCPKNNCKYCYHLAN